MITLIVRQNGGLEKFSKRLQRMKKLPDNCAEGVREWGMTILVPGIKEAAVEADIKSFTGTLYGDGIRWEQRPKGKVAKLFIRKYAIALDSMSTHYVSLTLTRQRLLSWASQAQSGTIRAGAAIVRRNIPGTHVSIRVQAHPFIRSGWLHSRPRLNPILQRKLRQTTR